MTLKSERIWMKAAAISTAIFLILPVAAQAQIGVKDVDVKTVLEQIKKEVESVDERGKETNEFEEDETKKHYEAELKRLDAMLESLGYYEISGVDVNSTTGRVSEFYDPLAPTDASRTAIKNIPIGDDENSAYSIDSLNSSVTIVDGVCPPGLTPASSYLCENGLVSASVLYPENPDLEKSMTSLYSALYLADSMVGQTDKARPIREQTYSNLLDKATEAKDLRELMELQNAILLENGRNLNLLINLQTAQLNSEAAALRKQARDSQIKRETFASTPVSSAVLTALVALDGTF